mmetsp:Transcript_4719/g.9534  ORF Transcript_4719/g.9534 Transcript_4719/m.9534 type:complete len:351 (-) Transcript_4719:1458-2510(-)
MDDRVSLRKAQSLRAKHNGSSRGYGMNSDSQVEGQVLFNEGQDAASSVLLGRRSESKGMQTLRKSVSLKREISASQRLIAARVLDTSQNAIEQRGLNLRKSSVREPLICWAPYGGPEWAMDLLAIPHNAIRGEIQDLYTILTSLNRRSLDLLPRDFDGFFHWFEFFQKLIERILGVEEDILFTWAEQPRPFEGRMLFKAARRKTLESLFQRLHNISSTRGDFGMSVEVESLERFFRTWEDFTEQLTDFFIECEKSVPTHIMRFFDPIEKRHIEEKLIKTINKGNLEYNFAMARGIGADYATFNRRYAPTFSRFSANYRKIYMDHVDIINAFVSLQKEYEKTYRRVKPMMC